MKQAGAGAAAVSVATLPVFATARVALADEAKPKVSPETAVQRLYEGLPGNVFYYQTLKANEVFGMLDGKQRKAALLDKAPREDDVKIRGPKANFPGIAVAELSADQKKLVEKVMHDLLAPYRAEDVKEAMGCLKTGGGMEKMH